MKKKYDFKLFKYYDFLGIEAYLKEMASKGFFLEKSGKYFWKFKIEEPKILNFHVDYFHEKSNADYEYPYHDRKLMEAAAENGWELVEDKEHRQVFSSKANREFIADEPFEKKVERLRRAYFKTRTIAFFASLVMFLLFIFTAYTVVRKSFIQFLSSGDLLTFVFINFITVVILGIETLQFYTWKKKMCVLNDRGKDYTYIPSSKYQIFLFIMLAFALLLHLFTSVMSPDFNIKKSVFIMLGVSAVMGAVSLLLNNFLKKLRIEKGINIMISVLLFLFVGSLSNHYVAEYVDPDEVIYSRSGDKYFGLYFAEIPDNGARMEYDSIDRDVSVFSTRIERCEYYYRELGKDAFAGSMLDIEEDNFERERISCVFIDTNFDFIYRYYEQHILYGASSYWLNGYELVNDDFWGANRVYKIKDRDGDAYLLCYDKKFIRLYFSWDLSETEREKVKDIILKSL